MVRPEKEESLKQKVYNFWVANPYITAREICKKLVNKPSETSAFYKKHGATINVRLSEFRSYSKLGSPQKALSPHKRIFVWEHIPRSLRPGVDREKALGFWGWAEVVNRNGMWVFRDDCGTVHWYKGGLVRLYLKGAVQLARAKELFARAFSFLSDDDLKKYLDCPLREEAKHWVFDVGAVMPRFDIRQFERTHGLRIFTDGSHPTAVEVVETTPFWIHELRQATGEFGVEIKEHLKLITQWQEEAKDARRRRKGWLKRFIEWLW